MKSFDQVTFWQFTVENAKEAIKLYFRPVHQAAAWLGGEERADSRHLENSLRQQAKRVDELIERKDSTDAQLSEIRQNQKAVETRLRHLERQLNPAFDSLEDLDLRVKRLSAWLDAKASADLTTDTRIRATAIETQLAKVGLHSGSEKEDALTDLRRRLRQLEVDLGFEEPLQRRGASGD